MSTFEAITVTENNTLQLGNIGPVDILSTNHVRVKVHAIGINPTDQKSSQYMAKPGVVVGCDAAGYVIEIGSNVSNIKVGDRVSGFVQGCKDTNNGAFADQVQFRAENVFLIPDDMKFEESVFLIPIITAALALFHHMKFPLPSTHQQKPDTTVLIWAASTSVGIQAVKLARTIGLNIIATCSPKNFDLVRSYGADVVVDYNEGEMAVKEIKLAAESLGNGQLTYALDCISTKDSMELTSKCLKGSPNSMISILPQSKDCKIASGVDNKFILMYTIAGVPFDFGTMHFDEQPEDVEFARNWLHVELPALLKENYQLSSKMILLPGANKSAIGTEFLDNVQKAFDLMKEKKISAQKLVITRAIV